MRRPPSRDLEYAARLLALASALVSALGHEHWYDGCEQDVALGIELTYDLEQWVLNLQMKRIPDSGHWVQQEKPEPVHTLMAEFLQEYYCSWFTANHGGANVSGQQ